MRKNFIPTIDISPLLNDFELSNPYLSIGEMLIVGIIFLVIYLKGFSVAID